MHQRCIRSRQRREEYYTRELATDHEQYLSGPPSHGGRRPGRGCRGDTRQRGGTHGSRLAATWQSSVVASLRWHRSRPAAIQERSSTACG